MFPEIIKELRKKAKFTQAELAAKLEVNQTTVSCWETGKATPPPEMLMTLAKFFGVSVDYLMGNSPTRQEKKKGILIPVLGDVRAGYPMEAVENILDYEEIDPEMASTGEYFGLRIKGDSMEPRFVEGDVIIVRKQSTADTGDIVVVLVDGESATVKKIRKHETGITLMPTNPAYEPLYFSNDEIISLPVTILGRVVELRAKF